MNDPEETPVEQAQRAAGEGAMELIDALGVPEVEEALTAYSEALFGAVRAFERAGLSRISIAGCLGGAVLGVTQRLGEQDGSD